MRAFAGAARAFIERAGDVRMRCAPGWQKAGEDSHNETRCGGEGENTRVWRNLINARNVRREKSFHRVESPNGEQQTGEAANDAEQDAFGEQLPHDVPASGAERGANADLFLPRNGTREKKISDIDAGDEPHACRHRAQHHQRGMRLAYDGVA